MNTSKIDLIRTMEDYFNGDMKRVDHAYRVMKNAERLLETEDGDYTIVVAAALFHDIGIHEAKRKHESTSGKYQEIEGPPIARKILTELGYEQSQIDEICEIIAHHHTPGKVLTNNFNILYDADWLVNLGGEFDVEDRDKISSIIERVFLTESGRSIAQELYLLA